MLPLRRTRGMAESDQTCGLQQNVPVNGLAQIIGFLRRGSPRSGRGRSSSIQTALLKSFVGWVYSPTASLGPAEECERGGRVHPPYTRISAEQNQTAIFNLLSSYPSIRRTTPISDLISALMALRSPGASIDPSALVAGSVRAVNPYPPPRRGADERRDAAKPCHSAPAAPSFSELRRATRRRIRR